MVTAPASYVPAKGDLIWLTFDPQAGHEQAGRRPALVLSNSDYNTRSGLAILCPITSRVKNYRYEVPLPPGYQTTGVILADQIKNMDWRARRADFIEKAADDLLVQVLAKLATII